MLPLDGRGDAHGKPEIVGAEDARFVAVQQSSNGDVMMAETLPDAFRLAAENPDTGVVLRFSGDGEPHNIGRLTGGDQAGDTGAAGTGRLADGGG
ncbi:IncF plasmid conjugative transfer DNA-nicking and unwinding protein TraI (plasmid) [Klebsiella sp. PL-2018]|nr:IncF plasmid conjugative transfer DNA-nicking and unwinding protein TraI [Klebsiella sp. PL-2018]